MRSLVLPLLPFALSLAGAQQPAVRATARVDYTLRVDSADPSGIAVEMRVRGAAPVFRLTMVAHTEYDDRYWRYLTDLAGESRRGPVRVTREDSVTWRVEGFPAEDDVTLRYRVRFPASPPQQQASWMAHLGATGGLVGGPHSFLYVIGGERAPVRVTVELPRGWELVTGLRAGSDSRTFAAPGIETLVDSPMLVGAMRSWRFDVGGVPHEIAYLGRADGTPFDTARFVRDVERIARATVAIFGRMPYERYHFLFEDGAYGGLEHRSSLSMGARSADLAREPNALLGQIAHEFVHTWNEVQLRPASWVGVRNLAPEPTGELWWSEGVTLYFADLVLRRAALPTIDSTRVARLERLIGNYLANPSQAMVSPEETSRAFNRPPYVTGDWTPSMFTQGEMLGTVLDLMILDASAGRRSLADAMRDLTRRFSIDRGFTGADVERAVARACGCEARPFFDRYVRAPGALDFPLWLGAVGLTMTVDSAPALARDGSPAPDLRVSAYPIEGDSAVALKIWFPATQWGRAGFHTGDRVESLDGAEIRDVAAFRTAIGRLHVGDALRVSVRRGAERLEKTIVVAGYDRPRVRISERGDAAPAQRALLARWADGLR